MIASVKDINYQTDKFKELIALVLDMLEQTTCVVIEDMGREQPWPRKHALQKILLDI